MTIPATRTLAQFTALTAFRDRLREVARDGALRVLSLGRRIDATSGWVRFPFYHHVFEDERKGFARQLDALRLSGEFLSLDDAIGLLSGGQPIDGRYFCVSFDDGFKSCLTGALPILAERRIPATFYVVSDLVGSTLAADDPVARGVFSFKGRNTGLDFLSWDDCRTMAEAGMTIGSHTCGHARLAALDEQAALAEMTLSRQAIEREIGRPCRHFCAPYGMPGRHFRSDRDPALARQAGYASFATALRGPSRAGADPLMLRRDHVLANWGSHQLRYFLSRP
jgi:peptidoglycan/xylan/chitin deacetylase (PgdA/CDA1 family)